MLGRRSDGNVPLGEKGILLKYSPLEQHQYSLMLFQRPIKFLCLNFIYLPFHIRPVQEFLEGKTFSGCYRNSENHREMVGRTFQGTEI